MSCMNKIDFVTDPLLAIAGFWVPRCPWQTEMPKCQNWEHSGLSKSASLRTFGGDVGGLELSIKIGKWILSPFLPSIIQQLLQHVKNGRRGLSITFLLYPLPPPPVLRCMSQNGKYWLYKIDWNVQGHCRISRLSPRWVFQTVTWWVTVPPLYNDTPATVTVLGTTDGLLLLKIISRLQWHNFGHPHTVNARRRRESQASGSRENTEWGTQTDCWRRRPLASFGGRAEEKSKVSRGVGGWTKRPINSTVFPLSQFFRNMVLTEVRKGKSWFDVSGEL